jgi:S-adenosylmethionine synthetase
MVLRAVYMKNGRVRNIRVETISQIPIEQQRIEIVERKGIGHPDSMADGIAEAMSRALCKEYKRRFGFVLHHNTDETQIVAGKSKPKFGGGEVISPIYILLVGRATKEFDGESIPTDTVVLRAAREYIHENFPNLKDEYVVLDCRIGEGSTELKDVFTRKDKVPCANDTSFGVGYAPFSETERLVYHTERYIVGELRKSEPAIGEDVKVMGVRKDNEIELTIACAMVDAYVDDPHHYAQIKEEIRERVFEIAQEYTQRSVKVFVNTADSDGCYYLTVTGTSAEMGDDGSVGRGNRCNGLITPYRPMSMEATSGKNPINHVGKIYNILSNQIASDIASEVDGVEEVYIRLLSQIGKPIDEPLVADAQILPEKGADIDKVQREARDIIERWLPNITEIVDMLIAGKLRTF